MDDPRKDDKIVATSGPRSRDELALPQGSPRPQSGGRASAVSGKADSALCLLSAGAAQGLVSALQPAFVATHGFDISTSFGAVGTIKAKLLAGEPCDVVILTEALIEELVYSGQVRREAAAPLGRVRTGVAVRAAASLPDVSNEAALRRTLLAATSLFVPDIRLSTAGMHVVKVLRALGVHDELVAKLRVHPNGAAAMRALATSDDDHAIGITQMTEISFIAGVTLAGALPTEFELATVYSAAVSSQARQADGARDFIGLMVAPQARELRHKAGFEG